MNQDASPVASQRIIYIFGSAHFKKHDSDLGPNQTKPPNHLADQQPPNSPSRLQPFLNPNLHFKYSDNRVVTTKYPGPWLFFPIFLMNQFRQSANFFFLFIASLQQIPNINPTHRFATLLPLSFILAISGIKEILEDGRRKKADEISNDMPYIVVDDGDSPELVTTRKCANLKVGDLVWVAEGETFPADLILVTSSNQNGTAYVETSNIDGETNLKVKQAALSLHAFGSECSETNPPRLAGFIECEGPSSKIYCFRGLLTLVSLSKCKPFENATTASATAINNPNPLSNHKPLDTVDDIRVPLSINQLLLRGSVLKNTFGIWGIVTYTGEDTKIRSAGRPDPVASVHWYSRLAAWLGGTIKRATIKPLTTVDRVTNRQLQLLCCLLLGFSLFSTLANFRHQISYASKLPYMATSYLTQNDETIWEMFAGFCMKFFTFLILYHNWVPISLLVTIELARVRLAQFIEADLNLYDEQSDSPTVVKNSCIVDELGRIDYVITDKTGTLTENKMELIQLGTIDGKIINVAGKHEWIDRASPLLDRLLGMLALCHTVIVSHAKASTNTIHPSPNLDSNKKSEGEPVIEYEASSPDELVIVKGCSQIGYRLVDRTQNCMNIQLPTGITNQYKILATIEFTSERKRMSILLSCEEEEGVERFFLICKGADSVIFDRLWKGPESEDSRDNLAASLFSFAKSGLRTLAYGYRDNLDRDFVTRWLRSWEGQTETEGKERLANEIETDLRLIGATGVEDRLQNGVPATIQSLLLAGIRIWMLTGDRVETAVSIGYSSRILDPEAKLVFLTEEKLETNDFAANLAQLETELLPNLCETAACTRNSIIIDGYCLDVLLDQTKETQMKFLNLAKTCPTVICARVSPLQKARVVQLIQSDGNVCLAIGDGANDVEMIQCANIGIGISGREGMLASRASDISIAQFRYLQRLMLVHGTWATHRTAKMILYSIYKNIFLYSNQLWFALLNLFSGQTVFETWMLSLYNVAFSYFIPLLIGITDQIVNARYLLSHPFLYNDNGQKQFDKLYPDDGLLYNASTFWLSALNGLYQSALACIFVAFTVKLSGPPLTDLLVFGSTLYACILLTIILKACLLLASWHFISVLVLTFSMLSWFLYVLLADKVLLSLNISSGLSDLAGLSSVLFSSPVFWFLLFSVPLVCLFRDICWKFWQRWYAPKRYHIVQELVLQDRRRAGGSTLDMESASSQDKLYRNSRLVSKSVNLMAPLPPPPSPKEHDHAHLPIDGTSR